MSAPFSPELATVDADDDGDIDIVTQGAGLVLTVFTNDAGDAGTWTAVPVAVEGGGLHIHGGDVDGDGDGDLVVATSGKLEGGALTDGLVWYERTDGLNYTRRVVDPALFGVAVRADLVDMDGDDDLNLLTTVNGGLGWYESDGTGGGWTQHPIPTPPTYNSLRVHDAIDMDADGDADPFGVDYLAPAIFWLENGADWAVHEIEDPSSYSLPDDAVASDIDQDCDLDLVVQLDQVIGFPDRIDWFENPIQIGGQEVRLGSPPNPASFVPADGIARVGERWEPRIAWSQFPTAGAALVVVALEPAELPLFGGSLLVDLDTTALQQFVLAGLDPSIPIPDTCSLFGLQVHAQAAILDGGTITPTNAIDVTIGGR